MELSISDVKLNFHCSFVSGHKKMDVVEFAFLKSFQKKSLEVSKSPCR